MTNVIIDTPNMIFRSLFMCGGYGAESYKYHTQMELDQLMRKISTDICYILRLINPNRVIFTFDSKSWRKSIKIEENDGYKANREKSTAINWDNIFRLINEFKDVLKSAGFIVSDIQNAEADDLISLWTYELLWKRNEHVIIVSSDEDIRQLVGANLIGGNNLSKAKFCTVYNPISYSKKVPKKLYVPDFFNKWIDTEDGNDIFNLSSDVDKDEYKRLRDQDGIKFEQIKGSDIALRKIFCGDDGDNIPAIYTWINDKGKETRITESKYEKIKETLNISDYLDLYDNADKILEMITTIAKQKPSINIKARIKRQIDLVVLDPNIFPIEIIDEFDKQKESLISQPFTHVSNLNMNMLLEGTRYVKEKTNYNESSVFKDIDKIINKTSKLF